MMRPEPVKELDLVDECNWEDHVEFITLEDAGLENTRDRDTVQAAQAIYYNEEY